jgi:hypothetical protein
MTNGVEESLEIPRLRKSQLEMTALKRQLSGNDNDY